MLDMGMPGCVQDSLETGHILRNELQAFAQKELRNQLAALRTKLREDFRAELLGLQQSYFSTALSVTDRATTPERTRDAPANAAESKKKTARKNPPMRFEDAPWRSPDSEELTFEGRLAMLSEARESAGRDGPIFLKAFRGHNGEANGKTLSKVATATAIEAIKHDLTTLKETEDDLSPKHAQLRLAASDERRTNGHKLPIQEPELNNPNPPAEPLQSLEVHDIEAMANCDDAPATKTLAPVDDSPELVIQTGPSMEEAWRPRVSNGSFLSTTSHQLVGLHSSYLQVPTGSHKKDISSMLSGQETRCKKSSPLASSSTSMRQAFLSKKAKSRIHGEETSLFFTSVKKHIAIGGNHKGRRTR